MNGSIDLVIVGNLSTEPELRQVGENTVCNFNVAVNRQGRNGREVIFFRCAAWNKIGDVVASYVQKGDAIKINTEWLDLGVYKNEAQVDINVTRVNLISNRRNASGQPSSNGNAPTEEIPF